MSNLISNKSRNYWWFIRVTAFLICTVMALAPAIADAEKEEGGEVEGEGEGEEKQRIVVVAEFNAALDHWPEGLAIDKSGNIYVTQGTAFFTGIISDGWIKKISSKGPEVTELAHFKDELGAAGIVVSANGDIFYAKPNLADNNLNGVYRLNDDGSTERLPGTENTILANGLALDKHGGLFIGDSLRGAVWQVPTDGEGTAQIWSDDALLGACDFGANGVAIWKDNLYVANTSAGLLARIPIRDDGSAGPAVLVAGDTGCDESDELFGMDGIALDVDGNVYALLVLQDKIVRINPDDGSVEVLLTAADGLNNPSSIAFGTGKGDRQSIFFVNYALFPDGPDSLGTAVLKWDVDVAGLPLP